MRIVNVDRDIIQKLRKTELYKEMSSLGFCDFLVLEERDGKIIGVSGIGGLLHVHSIQIDEQHRGEGLGKILLNAVIMEAKRREYSFILASFNPENTPSVRLHKSCGFYRIFRIHYSPKLIRDVTILMLKPRGRIVAKLLSIFNTIIGIAVLAVVLKISKSLSRHVLTLSPDEFPDPQVINIIRNFEKVSQV